MAALREHRENGKTACPWVIARLSSVTKRISCGTFGVSQGKYCIPLAIVYFSVCVYNLAGGCTKKFAKLNRGAQRFVPEHANFDWVTHFCVWINVTLTVVDHNCKTFELRKIHPFIFIKNISSRTLIHLILVSSFLFHLYFIF